jgi:hypothetical protein
VNNALSPHNQCGFYGPKQVLHFAPLKQCALIIIMWVLHFAPLKQCALIIIMWVLHFAPLNNVHWLSLCGYCILHLSTMCINYHYVGIAFCTFQQCALIIIMWALHFTPLKQRALIIIMWVLLHRVFKHCGFKVQSGYYICEHFQWWKV